MINDFLEQFKANITEEHRPKVGKPVIKAGKMYKFQVNVDPDYAWELKDMMSEWIQTANATLNGVQPR
eukprot:12394461-Karenia_brevis.AAC.1